MNADEKLKELRAGVEEMRSVARKLMAWASDLEKSFLKDAPAGKPAAEVPVSGEPVAAVAVPVASAAEPAVAVNAVVAVPVPGRAEVKAFLTAKCAAGYSAQVKALIASFGVSSLSEVPEECLSALMEAASLLGEGDG